jgi:hypothetical protein
MRSVGPQERPCEGQDILCMNESESMWKKAAWPEGRKKITKTLIHYSKYLDRNPNAGPPDNVYNVSNILRTDVSGWMTGIMLVIVAVSSAEVTM